MRRAEEPERRQAALGFAAVAVSFFFVNATTFTSLGVALWAMSGALHWSQAEAGFSYTLLGLACGLASPLPMLVVLRAGGRTTLCLGGLLLTTGFALAALAHGVLVFYAAMLLLGLGYSFAGNIPAVFLLSAWFPRAAARANGLYMMTGALGSTIGPLLVQQLLRVGGGWRGLWWMLAAAAGMLVLVCLLLVRDAAPKAEVPPMVSGADLRRGVGSLPFLLVALALTLTMMSLTTLSSVAMPILTGSGMSPRAVTLMLGVLALSDALSRGVAGRLCERLSPRSLLAAAMALQAAGDLTLVGTHDVPLQSLTAILIGSGCGLTYVSANMLMIGTFGRRTGSELLSLAWLVSTVAAIGPLAAGLVIDHTGGVAPVFLLYAVMFAGLGVSLVRGSGVARQAPMNAPVSRP